MNWTTRKTSTVVAFTLLVTGFVFLGFLYGGRVGRSPPNIYVIEGTPSARQQLVQMPQYESPLVSVFGLDFEVSADDFNFDGNPESDRKGLITLSGSVRLSGNGKEVQGDRIDIEIKKDRVVLSGSRLKYRDKEFRIGTSASLLDVLADSIGFGREKKWVILHGSESEPAVLAITRMGDDGTMTKQQEITGDEIILQPRDNGGYGISATGRPQLNSITPTPTPQRRPIS